MKLRIRTLSNEEAELEVGAEETVLNVKEKVEQRWPHMPAARQKLVHAGKILADAQKIKDCSALKENDRLVVMVTKAVSQPAVSSSTAASAAPASAASPSPAETQRGSSAAGSTAGDGESAKSETPGGSGNASGNSGGPANPAHASSPSSAPDATSEGLSRAAAESALFTGPQLEETLTHLVAMGFPRSQAEEAMRAAFNNPDRAVEYLMNGMPPEVSAMLGGDSAETQEAHGDVPPEEGDAEGDEDDENPLGALRHHPAFNQIRQMVQANPAMLPQVLQLIGNSNPQLLELITQNQDAFLEMLQSDQGEGETGAAGTGGFAAPGIIQMTAEEMEALQRLESLGFSRHQAVEAYLACDRNEEMAANYLFENLNDLGDDAGD
ncbi:UV excision repair protein Rad23 protein [Toxoplasma gondii ME49]|uniref:UV excision repair protein RAD23 n=18 Tax=Toxoplasma gondii TaxID=5811 RepID=A0A0F7UT30_TOXGV|nr:UV excision repair protein Rad23 protein [Toxoplasma gondii ME49]EPR57768.1 UV excision repair protein Rad23 protein [Toxoplasma gondii GT1]ESS29134.1 UV excision repair protein Rad23 protein [Toxoplasma gondii VEG]KAF4646280.1 UV excision repair protein Rad23 protein [Toxoplasma gondii]KFG35736.1 UV excision repair protein Rad23 protein [Toxoplasma gondii FOU]KFG37077.1 UV excision repair protein Rad23 protein [Toxoplasma gondii GAB2-2007-GAL-DOM2]KFH00351.1 UV excision repair protein Rad|eukprot:XP_018638523.1 UV excision repair protein Rad23 protein [Toxoplasma gondii ME49]